MHDSELLSELNSVLQSSFSTFAGKHSRAEWKYQLRQTVQGQEAQASVQHSVPSQKMPRLWPAVCHQDHPEHPPIEGARCRPSKPPMSPMWPRGRGSHVTHEKTPQSRRHRLPTLCQHFQQKVHSQQAHWTGGIFCSSSYWLRLSTIFRFISIFKSTSLPLVQSAIKCSARKVI